MKEILVIIFSVIIGLGIQSCNSSKTASQVLERSEPIAVESTQDTTNSLPLPYSIRGAYNRPFKQERLPVVRYLGDMIEHYPSKWITDYVSVNITFNSPTKEIKTLSKDEKLTDEQIALFESAQIGDYFDIQVKYNTTNPVTQEKEVKEMKVQMTVVPKREAAFIGGYDQLLQYLSKNSADKIDRKKLDMAQRVIRFTINETGTVENVKISLGTDDQETDAQLKTLISNMPAWAPAIDVHGKKVRQDFEFFAGMGEGC